MQVWNMKPISANSVQKTSFGNPTGQDVLSFWGKAERADGGSFRWHPVAYHLLDVAACVDALLESRPIMLERAARLFEVEPTRTKTLLVTLAALHDIGKFAPAFQGKVPPLWPGVLGSTASTATRPVSWHTRDGYALWYHELSTALAEKIWKGGRDALDCLAQGIFGHHGRPLDTSRVREELLSRSFGDIARVIAVACATDLVQLLMPDPIDASPPRGARARVASWWVAGAINFADWVGSNEESFPYRQPDIDLCAYWDRARSRSREVVRKERLGAPKPSCQKSFATLTGIQSNPTPMQAWASSVALESGPLLVIIEDVTGSGKTEAAQMLVHRLMAEGRVSGAYWAMPTQATANAMYLRQAKSIDELYSKGQQPSLVLAHGQASLHEGFRSTVMSSSGESGRASELLEIDDELPGNAACAAFFADRKRAALLADIGAGTIDQALLGVLPTKHNTLRLLGLADKVLVIDEAHAYDTYMSGEIRELLRFQAALGGSAIILSATLTTEKRAELVRWWMWGRSGVQPPHIDPAKTDYPLATVLGKSTEAPVERAIDAAPQSRRKVAVSFVDDLFKAKRHVTEAVRAGAAVVWIRNTVDDCLAAAALLRADGLEPLVFHARFAQCDRQAREQEVLRIFGPDACEAERYGRVLVATQVVEQSLDLDFDAMVSDLAPVDLLIQRAGRLQRHEKRNAARPAECGCELVVLSPPFTPEPRPDWLVSLLPGTARVYENTGVLWRTARTLQATRSIETPSGLRELVESAYDMADVPAGLEAVSGRAEGRAKSGGATANYVTLKVTDGYRGDQQVWVSDLRAVTRLEDEHTVIRLGRISETGQITPWASAESDWKAWALSDVRVRSSRIRYGAVAERGLQEAVTQARSEWGRYEQEIPLLPMRPRSGGSWHGVLFNEDKTSVVVRYTSHEGLGFV